MAPSNPNVDELKDTVQRLEARVARLEQRVSPNGNGVSTPPAGQGGVRIVLMGPPGAGVWQHFTPALRTVVRLL